MPKVQLGPTFSSWGDCMYESEKLVVFLICDFYTNLISQKRDHQGTDEGMCGFTLCIVAKSGV